MALRRRSNATTADRQIGLEIFLHFVSPLRGEICCLTWRTCCRKILVTGLGQVKMGARITKICSQVYYPTERTLCEFDPTPLREESTYLNNVSCQPEILQGLHLGIFSDYCCQVVSTKKHKCEVVGLARIRIVKNPRDPYIYRHGLS